MTISSFAFSQAKFEIQEFTGKVKSLRPGWSLALEVIELQVDNEVRYFRLDPMYGKSVLSKIKEGQTLTLKANINLTLRENYKKSGRELVTIWGFRFSDQVAAVHLNGEWVETPIQSQKNSIPGSKVYLEKKIISDFYLDGMRKGLIFKDGLVAFNLYTVPELNSMDALSPGTKVSFIGYESLVREEYLYPVQGVKGVYSFMELKRIEGKIGAFIHKENFVRIGMTVNGKRLSFSSTDARAIEKFANGEDVIVYYNGTEDKKTNLLPTIHAIVHESDTLYSPEMYYGGPDGQHEHKPVEIEGIIAKINRTAGGHIYSLIVNKDCYVEVSSRMAAQLGNFLRKGTELKIHGEERIKKEGEIYEKDYRIISPKRIVAGEKEYILNQ